MSIDLDKALLFSICLFLLFDFFSGRGEKIDCVHGSCLSVGNLAFWGGSTRLLFCSFTPSLVRADLSSVSVTMISAGSVFSLALAGQIHAPLAGVTFLCNFEEGKRR